MVGWCPFAGGVQSEMIFDWWLYLIGDDISSQTSHLCNQDYAIHASQNPLSRVFTSQDFDSVGKQTCEIGLQVSFHLSKFVSRTENVIMFKFVIQHYAAVRYERNASASLYCQSATVIVVLRLDPLHAETALRHLLMRHWESLMGELFFSHLVKGLCNVSQSLWQLYSL